MSKRSGGKNRVCLGCRIKYPGQFTHDPTRANVTSVCSECSGDLTLIPDSVTVPKKADTKGWDRLASEALTGEFSLNVSKHNAKRAFYKAHPEHEKVDQRLEKRERMRTFRAELQQIDATHPDLSSQVTTIWRRDNGSRYPHQALRTEIMALRKDDSEVLDAAVYRVISLLEILGTIKQDF